MDTKAPRVILFLIRTIQTTFVGLLYFSDSSPSTSHYVIISVFPIMLSSFSTNIQFNAVVFYSSTYFPIPTFLYIHLAPPPCCFSILALI